MFCPVAMLHNIINQAKQMMSTKVSLNTRLMYVTNINDIIFFISLVVRK